MSKENTTPLPNTSKKGSVQKSKSLKAKSSARKGGKGRNYQAAKSFQLVNGIITKDDIVPLCKSKTVQKTDEKSSEVPYEIIDSINASIACNIRYNKDEKNVEDTSVMDYARSNSNDTLFSSMEDNISITSFYDDVEKISFFQSTSDFPTYYNTTRKPIDEKEETTLNTLKDVHHNNGCIRLNNHHTIQNDKMEGVVTPNDAKNGLVLSQDYLSDIIDESLLHFSQETFNMDDQYGTDVKKVTYRNAEGNFTLKPREKGYIPVDSDYEEEGIEIADELFAQENSALRRESGIREMVSTGAGIDDFML